MEFPDGFLSFKRTPEFNENTLPEGLKANHKTAAGIWALIHVLDGRLDYFIAEPINKTLHLDPKRSGTVLPEVLHHVEPQGGVRFYVEFFEKRG